MKKQTVTRVLAVYILISLQGCATRTMETAGMPTVLEDIPDADPALDHYTAWVPRNAAQTPAVAVAQTHISMGYAKEQAAKRWCGNDWLTDEPVTERIGPVAVMAPETLGRYPAWYYRVGLQPGLQGCEQVSRQRLYRTIQESLPEWMRLELAVATPPDTAARLK